MQVKALTAPPLVSVSIKDPLPHVPDEITIMPQATWPFETTPKNHYLSQSFGEFGPPKALLDAARQVLAGEIDESTAEGLIAEALVQWSKLPH